MAIFILSLCYRHLGTKVDFLDQICLIKYTLHLFPIFGEGLYLRTASTMPIVVHLIQLQVFPLLSHRVLENANRVRIYFFYQVVFVKTHSHFKGFY